MGAMSRRGDLPGEKAILITNSQQRLVAWNRQGLELWGLTTKDITAVNRHPVLTRMAEQLGDPVDFLAVIELLEDQPALEIYDLLCLNPERVLDFHTYPLQLGAMVVGRVWCFRELRGFD